MKKLTKNQIDQLYIFTRQHFVEWYDVQIELVDHLANGIEEQWETQPNLNFETALKIEFKKFGVFGFSELVEQKTNALDKYYRKEIFMHFKTYLGLPKLIITLFSIWIIYLLLISVDNKPFVTVPFVGSALIVHFLFLFKQQREMKIRYKTTGKKWLFEQSMIQFGGLIHLLNLAIYFPINIDSNKQWTSTSTLVLSCCLVIYVLLLYIAISVVMPSVKESAIKQYSEYRLIKV